MKWTSRAAPLYRPSRTQRWNSPLRVNEKRFDYTVTSARESLQNYVAPAADAIEGKPKIGYGGAKGLAVLQALAAHVD